jgi:hypothetical protein
MRHLWILCIMVFLSVTSAFPARAQQSLPLGGADEPCASAEEPTLSLPVTAIVSTISLRRGRATLETEVGQLELAAAPTELLALQTGDVLTLCVDPAALPGTDATAPSPLG